MSTQSRWIDDHAGIVALAVFVAVVVLFVLLVANWPSAPSPDWGTGKSWCDAHGGVWTQLKDGTWFCFGTG